MKDDVPLDTPQPSAFNYAAGFLLVGIAWGLTTPFIRRAARDHRPSVHAILASEAVRRSWWKSRLYGPVFAVVDLLRNPRYAVPLLLNLTGSVWFFLLIGKAGQSVPSSLPVPFLIVVFVTGLAGVLTSPRQRVEFDGSHREHARLLVHRARGVVG